jgi:hypothetical protein
MSFIKKIKVKLANGSSIWFRSKKPDRTNNDPPFRGPVGWLTDNEIELIQKLQSEKRYSAELESAILDHVHGQEIDLDQQGLCRIYAEILNEYSEEATEREEKLKNRITELDSRLRRPRTGF